MVLLDFSYLKTNGDWTRTGDPEPPAAEIFATTLIVVDADTLMIRAASLPTKTV